jgi:hypothetical protein
LQEVFLDRLAVDGGGRAVKKSRPKAAFLLQCPAARSEAAVGRKVRKNRDDAPCGGTGPRMATPANRGTNR